MSESAGATGETGGSRATAADPKPELPAPEEPKPAEPRREAPLPAEPKPELPAPEPPKPEIVVPEEPKPKEPGPEIHFPTEPAPELPAPAEPEPREPRPEITFPTEPRPEVPVPAEPEPREPRPEVPAPPLPSPSIKAVEPDHGPLSGGLAITVMGEAFAEGCQVLLGGVAAPTARESETCLRVETPARAQKGIVELRAVNPDGQIAVYEDDFRYDPPPNIAGMEPACLSTEGGTVLTILGSDFAQGCAVRIDGALVPVSWVHAGRVEAVSRKHDAGEVDLAVENPDGQRALRERGLRFAAPPRVTAIAPASVLTTGGAEVRIEGAGFERACAVLVAGVPAAVTTFVGDTEIRFTAPPRDAAERVDVTVVNPTGLAHWLPLALSYAKAPPRVTSVTPDRGTSAGGAELTVRGHDFDEGAAVFVCGIAATVVSKSREELSVVTPAVARDGLVDVRVVNRDDQAHTLEKAFRYLAPLPPPQLRQVSPGSGSQIGGLEVAVLGEDFAEGVRVLFGGVAAATRFLTGKELKVTTPAFAGAGEVAVEVVNPDGASSVLEAAFTYEARPAPEITGISPTSGPTTGGTRVIVEGKNFTREAAVFFGREHPKDVAFKSATEIAIVTAARKQAGVVDVEVAVPGAAKGVMKNGFRYDAVPAPVITSVSPTAGGVGGGTELTVSGKNFLKETMVLVDGKAPRATKIVDGATIELKTPPGEAGKMVDVMVRNPDGKEAVQKRAFLYDPRYRG